MDEISPDAVRAARDLRVLLGRLVRRLREVYDTSALTPAHAAAYLDPFKPTGATKAVECPAGLVCHLVYVQP